MARTVTFTIHYPDDTPWTEVVLKFSLLEGDYTATIQYPRWSLSAAATDSNGAGSIDLWQNANGAEDTLYECLLPSGETFTFVVPAGSADITLSTLRGGSFPTPIGDHFQLSDYTDLADAVSSIGTIVGTLLIDTSDTLTADLTVPNTLTLLRFDPDNVIDLDTYTLAIEGPLEAGKYQFFDSSSGILTIDEFLVTDAEALSTSRAEILIEDLTDGDTPELNETIVWKGAVDRWLFGANQVSLDPYYFYTFTSDPHTEVFSVDGYAERGGANDDWSVIISSAGNIYNDTGNTLIVHVVAAAAPNTDKWQGVRRVIMLFYIGFAVDASATIISAALTIQPATITNELGGKLVVCETDPASNTQIRAPDYLSVGSVALSNYVALSDLTSGKPARFTLNAAGRAVIAAHLADDGVVKLGIRSDWDLDDTEPTWVDAKKDLVSFPSSEGVPDPQFDLVWSVME